MRGEHTFESAPTSCRLESSPRARGAPGAPALDVARVRIIPAYAGSTRQCPGPAASPRDHPRMRGEHILADWRAGLFAESSPHARGARNPWLEAFKGLGIIPACAGNTTRASSACRGAGDHPRMRGEHLYASPKACAVVGSSPHARGAQGLKLAEHAVGGIIPAYAGNTTSRCTTSSRRGNHPRMRGEHAAMAWSPAAWRGSSPHARGAL